MFKKQQITFVALSLMLLNTHANAGFFDNLTDNLKSGDIGSLLTDAVKDVAEEVAKGNQNRASSKEEKEEYAGTNFGSSATYNEDEEDYDEDEYLEEEYAEKDQKNTAVKTQALTKPEDDKNLEVDKKDLDVESCLFCSMKKANTYYYKKKLFTGIANTYKEAVLETKDYFSNGLVTQSDHFYPSGQIKEQAYFKYDEGIDNFVFHGSYKKWYENGQVNLQSENRNTACIADGLLQVWFENGQIKEESTGAYIVGLRADGNKACHYVGLQTFWYENGNLSQTQVFNDNGTEEGEIKKWYENGKLKFEGAQYNGKKDGLFKVWHSDGRKDVLETFAQGRLMEQTPWTEEDNTPENLSDSYFNIQVVDVNEPWDQNLYIKKNVLGLDLNLINSNNIVRARIGDPKKLIAPVIKAKDRHTSVTVHKFKKILKNAKEHHHKLKRESNKRFDKNLNEGKIRFEIAGDKYKVRELIFHLNNYLDYEDEERSEYIHKERVREVIKNPKKYSTEIKQTLNDVTGLAMADLLLGTDIRGLAKGLEKINIPFTKEEKRDRLMEFITTVGNFRMVYEVIGLDELYTKVPQYKPYQKDILLSDLKSSVSIATKFIKKQSGKISFTGAQTLDADKGLSVYTHDYKTYDIDKEKQFLLLPDGYDQNDYKLNIDKVQYVYEDGKLKNIVGLYSQQHPAFEVSIKNGKYHGEYKEYYKPSLINNKGEATNEWHSNLAKIATYKKGTKQGYYRQFTKPTSITVSDRFGSEFSFVQPKLVAEQKYKNGKLHGELLYVYPTSMKPSIVGEYSNGKKSGEWKRYKYGNLVPNLPNIVEAFKKGRLTQRHSNAHIDDLKIDKLGVAKFKHNNKLFTGQAILYYENGKRSEATFYVKGMKEGVTVNYYENGYPKESFNYENGKLKGLARKWDQRGYIVGESYYKNGQKNGIDRAYYSFDEMNKAGHVYSDVAWSTKDVDLRGKTQYDIKGYLQVGAKNMDNKHTDYVVAVYPEGANGFLVTDIAYSKNVMSHPAVGFSTSMPIKSVVNIKDGVAHGEHITYYPNGHIWEQGSLSKGNKDGHWSEYHAWRPNKGRAGNILLKTQKYNDGSLVSEKVHTTDKKLNTYAGRDYKSSYKLDMKYVTGMRQLGHCFNCSSPKDRPQFDHGFELRRNWLTGTLPKAIADVAQKQTSIRVASKDTREYKDRQHIGHSISGLRLSLNLDPLGSKTMYISSGKDEISARWNDSTHPKYSIDNITGGYRVSDKNWWTKDEIKFSKYKNNKKKDKTFNIYSKEHFNLEGFELEKYIAKRGQEAFNHVNKKTYKLNKNYYGQAHVVDFKDKSLNNSICSAKDSVYVSKFNRTNGQRDSAQDGSLNDSAIYTIHKEKFTHWDESSKFNKSLFKNMDTAKYVKDLKAIDFYEDDFATYVEFLKSWKYYTKSNKSKQEGPTLDWSEVKLDKGFLSTTIVEKATGEDYSGWVTGRKVDGYIDDMQLAKGVPIRDLMYSEKTGVLLADLSWDYQSNTQSGPQFKYHENGSLKEAGLKYKGADVLFKVSFFEDGSVEKSEMFRGGINRGYATSYWNNGNVKNQLKYSHVEKKQVATSECNEDGTKKSPKI